MAFKVKHVVAAVIFLSFSLILFNFYVISYFNHQKKAVILRLQTVFMFQSFLSYASFLFWKTLRPLPNILLPSIGHTVKSESLCRKSLWSNSFQSSESSMEETKNLKNIIWETLLGCFIFLSHLSYFTNYILIQTEPHWFSFLTYACLGTLIQFSTGLLLFKFISWFIRQICFYTMQSSERKPNEFKLSRKMTLCFTLSYMLLTSCLGLHTASQLPPVKSIQIPIHDLHPTLHNFHIVQLSDIHLGPTVGQTRLQRIVNIVNKENPDVVVITGDLVDGLTKDLKEAANPLKRINSKHGVLFSSGNHEYYTGDVDNWFQLLRSFGIKVLDNSNVRVPSGSPQYICFAGTDDLQADVSRYGNHTFNVAKAVAGCGTNRPTILLAHQPRAAKMAVDEDLGIDLVLSGHTHGGQMFPFVILAYLANPFYAGLYSYKGSQVYVSTGSQYWGIPMRIGTSMEITSITLTPR